LKINIDFNINATLRNRLVDGIPNEDNYSETFEDGGYVELSFLDQIIHLKEFNSFYEKENFELEVFISGSDGSLRPLKMFKQTTKIVNDILIDNIEEEFRPQEIPGGKLVEYYFDIEVDT